MCCRHAINLIILSRLYFSYNLTASKLLTTVCALLAHNIDTLHHSSNIISLHFHSSQLPTYDI